MTDRDALLRTILLDPADDVARLVYADWLEEHGEPLRAAFIRLQVAEPERAVTFGRKKMPGGRWAWGVTKFGLPNFVRWERLATALARTVLPPAVRSLAAHYRYVRVTIRRGFIADVQLPAGVWERHGPALVREQPIEVLKIAPRLERRDDLLRGAKLAAGLFGEEAEA